MIKKLKNVYSSCSLICPQNHLSKYSLFLGDAQAANDPKTLSQHRIKSILSIGWQTIPSHKQKGISYYNLALRDQNSQDASKYFEWAIDIIDRGRQEGNVLVHCYYGVSRSATFVIAYLMKKGNMGFQDGFKFVKERRHCIGPNQGFVQQLRAFEAVCVSGKEEGKKQQEPKQGIKQ